jgi:hypothetical protein
MTDQNGFWRDCGHDDSAGPSYLPMYYDRQGKTLCLMCWAKRREDRPDYPRGYMRVAETILGLGSEDEVRISTVWIGMDMNYARIGPPIIFETMIFGGALDENMWRYATEDEAVEGHRVAVALVRAALALERATPLMLLKDGQDDV